MTRKSHFIGVAATLVWLIAACGVTSTLKGDPLGADHAVAGAQAAAAVSDALESRTFTSEVGGVHACSEYVTTMLIAAWEPDEESWMITFTGGYEPGTRIFRLREADMMFTQIAGPPLAAECGVR